MAFSPIFVLKYIAYQLYYYYLGTFAMIEDYKYRKRNRAELSNKAGRVSVITGGARGIGVEVVKALLKCEMHVIIGCRSLDAGNSTIKSIRDEGISTGTIECLKLDIGSMSSIKSFATEVKKRHKALHLLVNNAGIMFVPYALTEDNLESHFAVNYLGHFLLTHLLLPNLKAGGDANMKSRIVNVSSCAHMAGKIHFEDLSMKQCYIESAAYAQSKLAQVLFTEALQARLIADDSPVQVHSVHPGIVNTDLFNNTTLKTVAPWVPKLFFKTPKQGASSIVFASISPKLEGKGGTYISNCRISTSSELSKSKEIQDELWDVSLNLLQVQIFGEAQ